jgi:hypothetical protein
MEFFKAFEREFIVDDAISPQHRIVPCRALTDIESTYLNQQMSDYWIPEVMNAG